MICTPPIPLRAIASRLAVMSGLVTAQPGHNHQIQGLAEADELTKCAAKALPGSAASKARFETLFTALPLTVRGGFDSPAQPFARVRRPATKAMIVTFCLFMIVRLLIMGLLFTKG
jgi:hypothetical protein